MLGAARAKLLVIRAQRIPPARDEKVLTSWNALMIRALAISARALARPDLAAAATRTLDFIRASYGVTGVCWRPTWVGVRT